MKLRDFMEYLPADMKLLKDGSNIYVYESSFANEEFYDYGIFDKISIKSLKANGLSLDSIPGMHIDDIINSIKYALCSYGVPIKKINSIPDPANWASELISQGYTNIPQDIVEFCYLLKIGHTDRVGKDDELIIQTPTDDEFHCIRNSGYYLKIA